MHQEFTPAAASLPDPFRLRLHEACTSTSDEARALGLAGAPGGDIVVANLQTAGRGRRGAAWHAIPGESLTFSILWRPEIPQALWPRLALAAGLAVAEACETHVPLAGIKWPNDVWISNRKVAGILVEAGPDFAVVGIGINVNTASFPDEIRDLATSIQIESGRPADRGELLGKIITRFSIHANRLDRDFETLLNGVRQRCVLTGHQVDLQSPSGPVDGQCEGIGSSGELLVRTDQGLQHILQADEVRPRPLPIDVPSARVDR
ncbi:MAG: biotin--[acetyl-CoA-carboxylase] ligase [Luteolibacter sp.]|jgi:BirA family transcriptional regulator, biotin operon repressor / biotin---[acetyl-CoA-carboxylase] ligase